MNDFSLKKGAFLDGNKFACMEDAFIANSYVTGI
jgi:hypothetical protein